MLKKTLLFRPINLAMIAFTMLIVLYKYPHENVDSFVYLAFLLIMPAITTAAAGYVINDIKDIKADLINKPHKTYINNIVSIPQAWSFYFILNIVGIVLAFLFSSLYGCIVISIIAALCLYAYFLKGTPLIGNLLIAACSAAIISICLLIVTPQTTIGKINIFGYLIFSFIVTLIRELVKDIQDVNGDLAAGYNTYPIFMGIKASKALAYIMVVLLMLSCGIYSFIAFKMQEYLSAFTMSIITISFFVFINKLSKANSYQQYNYCSNMLKLIMIAGVINLIVS